LSRNVGKKLPFYAAKNPETPPPPPKKKKKRGSLLQLGESLKSRPLNVVSFLFGRFDIIRSKGSFVYLEVLWIYVDKVPSFIWK
jgi:hypothetical protein